jgi:hypothetical protein
METQEKVKVFGVYLGQHDANGHKYLFFESLDSNTGDSAFGRVLERGNFNTKLGATEIGGIYEFHQSGKSYSFAKKPNLIAWWKNSDDRLQWRTLSRAYQDSKKKPANEKVLKELAEPLRQIYLSADYSTRAYILGEVIRLVTQGK